MAQRMRQGTWLILIAAAVLCGTALSSPELARVRIMLDGKLLPEAYQARYDGRELYVSLDLVRAVGCTFTMGRREESALVRTPDKTEREIALTRLSGALMVALTDLVGMVDLTYRVEKDLCTVETAGYRKRTATAKRTAEVAATQKPEELDGPRPAPTTSAKAPTQSVRPSSEASPAAASRPPATRESERPGAVRDAATVQHGDPVDTPATEVRAEETGGASDERASLPSRGATNVPAKSPASRIRDVVCEAVDPAQALLRILADGQMNPRVTMLKDQPVLAVDIPGAILGTPTTSWVFSHPLVAGVEALAGPASNVTRLLIRLSRLVTFKTRPAPPDGFEISLRLPRLTGRRIEEMTVVLDPGHGGPSATGCSAVHEGQRVYEKNLTLSMARKVYDRLRRMGMNVILTRSDDAAVSLADRPRLANDNSADLFLSIHVDFAPGNSSASGTTAYYHGTDENGRALAYVLSRAVSRAGGFPNRGARSDLERFVTGMAVLRRAEMPAVLLEVAFLSNPQDRAKLLRDDFQARVADAIAEGLRAYIEARIPAVEAASGDGG